MCCTSTGFKYFYQKRTSRVIKKNIKKNDTRKTIEEKIDFVSDYNNLKENIGTQLTTLSISKEEIQKINYIIDEKAKETKQVIEEMKREVAMYQQQVTLGKLISVLMHEGRKHISALRETPDILQKRIKQFLKNPSDEIHESINFNMAAISTHSLMINNLFNKIDPLARKRNPNKKVFSLEKAFRTAKKSFETPLLENNITIEENFEISEIFGWEIDFITAFTNLIDNSIYWMNTKEMKRIKISSQLDNNKVLIKYTDSGEGIPVKYLENDSIFEPGISYKIDGTGLGLAIAGEALKRNEFTLKAIEYTEGAYFTIEGCEENNGTN